MKNLISSSSSKLIFIVGDGFRDPTGPSILKEFFDLFNFLIHSYFN